MISAKTSTDKLTGMRSERNIAALTDSAWALRDDEPTLARLLAEEALAAATDYPVGRARALVTLGFLAYRESRYDQALTHAFTALRLLEAIELEAWLPRLFNVLALCYMDLGERAQALAFYDKQLEWAQKLATEDDLFAAHHDHGFFFLTFGDNVRALACFKQAQAYVGSDPKREAFLQMSFACLYAIEGRLEYAQESAERARDLGHVSGTTRVICFSLEVLAEVLLKRADYCGALGIYADILRFNEEMQKSPGKASLAIARIHLIAGHLDEAQAELGTAVAELERVGERCSLAEAHKLLQALYKRRQEFELALHHSEKFHAYYEATFNEESEMRVRALDVVHRMDALRQESELLLRENQELERHFKELGKLHERVRELSVRDALTGLYNRRYLLEQAERLFSVARRYEQPLSVVMLDIDHFKRVNDTYGHHTGDEVLRCVATILARTLRETDVVARYGGEEFAIMMPDTTLESAAAICEPLRRRVGDYDWQELHPELGVTISVGIAVATREASEALFTLADERLYAAKRSGRNQVCPTPDTI